VRLVTWNCNGAFRRKLEAIDALDADVLVIQECEDPSQSTHDYKAWAGDHAWVGYGKNKGIGIFPRRGQSIERLAWSDNGFELFLPVRVGGEVDVLGVWTQQSSSSSLGYIGQFWHYLQAHKTALGPRAIIAGDFNSNTIWDRPRRTWNHSDCVRELADLGFRSLYHHLIDEEQGQERNPTFYLHRHETKPYHIDYLFVHETMLEGVTPTVQIGNRIDWIGVSDHMPLLVSMLERDQRHGD
jgi:exonuclease III